MIFATEISIILSATGPREVSDLQARLPRRVTKCTWLPAAPERSRPQASRGDVAEPWGWRMVAVELIIRFDPGFLAVSFSTEEVRHGRWSPA